MAKTIKGGKIIYKNVIKKPDEVKKKKRDSRKYFET